jgi:hypothetical protein
MGAIISTDRAPETLVEDLDRLLSSGVIKGCQCGPAPKFRDGRIGYNRGKGRPVQGYASTRTLTRINAYFDRSRKMMRVWPPVSTIITVSSVKLYTLRHLALAKLR